MNISQLLLIVTIFMRNVFSLIILNESNKTIIDPLYDWTQDNRFVHFNYEELTTPEVEVFNITTHPENVTMVYGNVTINSENVTTDIGNVTTIHESITIDSDKTLTNWTNLNGTRETHYYITRDILNIFKSLANKTFYEQSLDPNKDLGYNSSKNVDLQEVILKWYLIYLNSTRGDVFFPLNVGNNTLDLTEWRLYNYIVSYISNMIKKSQPGHKSFRNNIEELAAIYNAAPVEANNPSLDSKPPMKIDIKKYNDEAVISEYRDAKKDLVSGKVSDFSGNISDSDLALINKFKERYKRNKLKGKGVRKGRIKKINHFGNFSNERIKMYSDIPEIPYSNQPGYPDPGGGWLPGYGNQNGKGEQLPENYPNNGINVQQSYVGVTGNDGPERGSFRDKVLSSGVTNHNYMRYPGIQGNSHITEALGDLGNEFLGDHAPRDPWEPPSRPERGFPGDGRPIYPGARPGLGYYPGNEHYPNDYPGRQNPSIPSPSFPPTTVNTSPFGTSPTIDQEVPTDNIENQEHPGFPVPVYTETSGTIPDMGSPPNRPQYPGINPTIPSPTLSPTDTNVPTTTHYSPPIETNTTIEQEVPTDNLENPDHPGFPVPVYTETSGTIPDMGSPPNRPPYPGINPTFPSQTLPPTDPNVLTTTHYSPPIETNTTIEQEVPTNNLENPDHPGFPVPVYTETSGTIPDMGSPPNPPPYLGIHPTIPSPTLPPTDPNVPTTTQYPPPIETNTTILQEDTTLHLENPGHSGYTESTISIPDSPHYLPTHSGSQDNPGHIVSTPLADPKRPLGSLIGSASSNPTMTTVNPFVSGLVDDMEARRNGYLSTFLIKLFELLATKNRENLSPLLIEMEATVNRLCEMQHTMEFGEPLTTVLVKYSRLLTTAPPDVIQSQCSLAYYYLTHRRVVMSPEMNAVVDYADSLYKDHEGIRLFESLEGVKAFPNTAKTARVLAIEVIDEALLEPFKRMMGTEKKKILLDNLNKALLKHFPIRRFADETREASAVKFSQKDTSGISVKNNNIQKRKITSNTTRQHKKYDKIHGNFEQIKMNHTKMYEKHLQDKTVNRKRKKTKIYFTKQRKHERRLSHLNEYYLRNNMLKKNIIHSSAKDNKLKFKRKTTSNKFSRKFHENKYINFIPVSNSIDDLPNVKTKQYGGRSQTNSKTFSYHRSTKINNLNYDMLKELKINKIIEESSYSDEGKWIKLNLYNALMRHGGKKYDALDKKSHYFEKYNKIDYVSSYSNEEIVLKSKIYNFFGNSSHRL